MIKHSGYSNISLPLQQSSTSHIKQQRNHNVWFNLPYSLPVITNVAKKFLQLLHLHFPPSNKFQKFFSKNNVKVSYCCTQNMGNIKSCNKKLINSSNYHAQLSNCRKKEDCPLVGKCITENIIHKCLVSTFDQPDKAYLGNV